MFWEYGRGEHPSKLGGSPAGDRRSPLRIHIKFGIDIVFSSDLCYNGLTKSLALWERWRRSRRRGQIVATTTLSPAIAGALPEGEPKDTCIFRGMGIDLCLCNTKAKLAIKQNIMEDCKWYMI